MALSAFGKAFAEARKSGDKEFTFNGKRYTTELKDNKTVYPQVTPKPKDLTSDEMAAQGRYDTSRNYVSRSGDYVSSGKKSFDTEKESVPPDMSSYKPRREPKPLTEVTKPGTNTNYENTSEDIYKKGGLTASRRGDGIAQRGKTRGTIVMCGGGYMKGKK